jgi:hypothetical protein
LGVADEIGFRTVVGGQEQSDDHNSSWALAAANNDITITVPLKLRRRGVETKLVIESADGNAAPRLLDPPIGERSEWSLWTGAMIGSIWTISTPMRRTRSDCCARPIAGHSAAPRIATGLKAALFLPPWG